MEEEKIQEKGGGARRKGREGGEEPRIREGGWRARNKRKY